MTEKCVLREAVRDVITDMAYKRQNHPFLSPDDIFHAFVNDTLRGEPFAANPFFNQKRVVQLLDRLPEMDVGARTANHQVLMQLPSTAVLHERFSLA